jgi:methyl-accepting chemotaxis protein
LPRSSNLGTIKTTLTQTVSHITDRRSGLIRLNQLSDGAQALAQGVTDRGFREQLSLPCCLSRTSSKRRHRRGGCEEYADAVGIEVAQQRFMQEMISAMADISDKSGRIESIIQTIENCFPNQSACLECSC